MAELSVLADMIHKMKGSRYAPGILQTRISDKPPAAAGMVRGTSGVLGSRTFKGRNSMAGLNKEQEMLNSPVMKAFLKKTTPSMPVTRSLRGY